MATYVGKAASKHFAKRFAPPDPYYETYSDEKGKHKQRKRALPPGLSKRDAAILRSVRKRAHRLDEGIRICGLTFGWTFVIGIIPVVGDVANLTLNHVLVIKKAKKADIPPSLLRSMEVHNVISTGMGMIPVIGDISVAIYKPNTRNAAMLEEFLRIQGEEALRLNPEGDGRGSAALRGRRGSSCFWYEYASGYWAKQSKSRWTLCLENLLYLEHTSGTRNLCNCIREFVNQREWP
ncbi:hypothetical protein AGABI1DRAFT_107797 [Agaricus bisporus var. burnettii JB137-S8]|uniref:Uncharacterized protein n=1 Tax=Agaricus bisporus var. burnettii (strain JB137-S8 / ATCC MYA-4627 / FGSC 10392) TaxID=597362 RepID=K5X533_AGABU|nr:uncharacterized protein AGABI1DRAFT_107797 [Agaricus bisporus var. burnettii JB137-S8]EKM78047.1 hypothetical protein AGABI1DRAFT_107797 [Agaricus bisporus var. burnettii JB137-S8]